MSAAAGLGALAQGFVSGAKLGSDMATEEKRRGLMGLQMQREEEAMRREQEMAALRQGIAQEVQNFQPDPNDPESFNRHYETLKPLMMKQAALSGVDPTLVAEQFDQRRRTKYAERLYGALTDIRSGDPNGLQQIKSIYNSEFKDGNQITDAVYDRETDKITMMVKGKDGQVMPWSAPREDFIRQAFQIGNTVDAIRFDVKEAMERRATEQKQGFELKTLGMQLDARAKEGQLDRDAALQRTNISAGASVAAAREGRDNRGDREERQLYERNRDQFVSGLPAAFDYDPKAPLKQAGASSRFNEQSAKALTIWEATANSGANLSASQVAYVMDGIQNKSAKVLQSKDGYAVVQVGAIKAVVPMK